MAAKKRKAKRAKRGAIGKVGKIGKITFVYFNGDVSEFLDSLVKKMKEPGVAEKLAEAIQTAGVGVTAAYQAEAANAAKPPRPRRNSARGPQHSFDEEEPS